MTRNTAAAFLTTTFVAGVLAALVAGSPTASAAICDPAEFDLTTGGDKIANVQDPYGAPDAQWTLVGGPGTPAGSAYSIPALSPPWVQDPPYANWISPWSAQTPGGNILAPLSTAQNGFQPYVYKTTFPISEGSFDEVQLNLRFAADDTIDFYLNGVWIGGAGVFSQTIGFTTWHSLSVSDTLPGPGPFVDGPNVLEAHVENYLVWTGFVAVGSVVQSCDPCAFVQDLTTGITNGSTNGYGTNDDDWFMTMIDDVPTPSHPAPYSVSPYPGWLTPASGTWISPIGSPTGISNRTAPVGWYTYEMEIGLLCDMSEYSYCALDFVYAADNNVEILLNGNSIAGPRINAFQTTAPVTIVDCADLVAGTNFLTARVYNSGAPTGFHLAGSLEVI